MAHQLRLQKSMSQPLSKYSSRLDLREEKEDAERDALIQKLKGKGVFDKQKRMVQSLYTLRA